VLVLQALALALALVPGRWLVLADCTVLLAWCWCCWQRSYAPPSSPCRARRAVDMPLAHALVPNPRSSEVPTAHAG
jgi:hypothetical protein